MNQREKAMSTSPPKAVLRGFAVHVPATALTNEMLATEYPSWDMEWVAKRVGLTSRRIAASGTTASDLAFAAAEALIARLDINRATIDHVIFCTQTPDYFSPASACVLQHRLGMPNTTAAFDINQGCTGFVYGLYVAQALVRSGVARNVLLLTGDTLARTVEPDDKSVRVLFGDAGSAALVSLDGPGAVLGETVLGTDGSGSASLTITGAFRCDDERAQADDRRVAAPQTRMDGQAVQAFAMQRVPGLVNAVVERNGVTLDDIRMVVFHQANALINERIANRLKLSRDRAPIYFDGFGNTASCTIPIVLTNAASALRNGDRVVLCGFGVGLSWAAMMIEWGEIPTILSDEAGAAAYLVQSPA